CAKRRASWASGSLPSEHGPSPSASRHIGRLPPAIAPSRLPTLCRPMSSPSAKCGPRGRAKASDPHLHPVIGDLPACTFDRDAFGRAFAQNGIGVVDVDEDLAADAERSQLGNAARVPRHVHMADALAGLVEQALGDHLVIGIERAVEEEERRAFDPRTKCIVKPGAAWDIKEVTPRGGVADLEARGVAFLRAEISLRGLVLEIERNFARHG